MAVAVKVETMETLRDDIAVSEIFVDDSYGRPLNERNLDRLVRDWDRARVGVVYLSLRDDGSFACLDGWHRVCACRTVEGEDATLPARVYIDLDQQGEAELFSAFNRDRAQPKPGELFRARLAMGEPSATEIYGIVTDLGMDISFDGGAKDGALQAVAALDNVYSAHGAKMLREVLLTLRNTMGTASGAIQHPVIKGLAAFLLRYGEIADRERLFGVLARTSTPRLLGMANNLRAMSSKLNSPNAVGMAILQSYNDGARGKQLPAWQERVYHSEKTRAIHAATARENIKVAHAANRAKRNGNGAS